MKNNIYLDDETKIYPFLHFKTIIYGLQVGQNFIENFLGKGEGWQNLEIQGGTFCHPATTKIQGG